MKSVSRFLSYAVECYATAEIMWTVLHPGEPHLYELGIEHVKRFRDGVEYRVAVHETLRSIRRLPEHDA
jgi:hypothetical protein